MRKSIPLNWIAEAEARSVWEKALLQRAASEPHITVLYARNTRSRLPWVKSFRGLLRAICRKTAAARLSSTEEDFDRVLVTILITDIVNSTRQVVEVGDRAWRILLNRHDDATRYQVKRFGGLNIGNRGDGFVSIFDSPARAVRCAAAIAETIAQLGISIRCGLHVGEVHMQGKEISGIAVHIAARIAAKASPGEAFVSNAVHDLVAGSGLLFEDRGIHQLRGLPEKIQLYAARAIGQAANTKVSDLERICAIGLSQPGCFGPYSSASSHAQLKLPRLVPLGVNQ